MRKTVLRRRTGCDGGMLFVTGDASLPFTELYMTMFGRSDDDMFPGVDMISTVSMLR